MRNPNLAMEQITRMNDILGYADDTLAFGENLFDIRRTVDVISLEIKKMSLEINPAKCSLLLTSENLE